MGVNHPKITPQLFFSNYRYVKTFEDDVFHKLYLFQSPQDNHQVYLQTVPLDAKGKLTFKEVKECYDYHHWNLLHVFNFFETTGEAFNVQLKQEVFNDDERLHILILEVFDSDLNEDIQARKEAGKSFSEDELWDMADNLISALAYLQNKGLSHQNIKINTILNCKGNYKVNYLPSVVRYLTQSMTHQTKDSNYKEDSKALGRCLLTASNLGKYESASNDADRIAFAGERYSPAWTNFLRDLILNPTEKRPDALTVYCKSAPIQELERSVSGHYPYDIYQPPELKKLQSPKQEKQSFVFVPQNAYVTQPSIQKPLYVSSLQTTPLYLPQTSLQKPQYSQAFNQFLQYSQPMQINPINPLQPNYNFLYTQPFKVQETIAQKVQRNFVHNPVYTSNYIPPQIPTSYLKKPV